jgi:hypothetical protein
VTVRFIEEDGSRETCDGVSRVGGGAKGLGGGGGAGRVTDPRSC